jgi:hypothetical protein
VENNSPIARLLAAQLIEHKQINGFVFLGRFQNCMNDPLNFYYCVKTDCIRREDGSTYKMKDTVHGSPVFAMTKAAWFVMEIKEWMKKNQTQLPGF